MYSNPNCNAQKNNATKKTTGDPKNNYQFVGMKNQVQPPITIVSTKMLQLFKGKRNFLIVNNVVKDMVNIDQHPRKQTKKCCNPRMKPSVKNKRNTA